MKELNLDVDVLSPKNILIGLRIYSNESEKGFSLGFFLFSVSVIVKQIA